MQLYGSILSDSMVLNHKGHLKLPGLECYLGWVAQNLFKCVPGTRIVK